MSITAQLAAYLDGLHGEAKAYATHDEVRAFRGFALACRVARGKAMSS